MVERERMRILFIQTVDSFLTLSHNLRKKMKVLKIVIAIVMVFSLLVWTLSPNPEDYGSGSYTSKQISYFLMKSMVTPLKMFKLDNAIYPSRKEGLKALVKNPNSNKYPNYTPIAYLEKVPLDAWQNPFIYIPYKTEKGNAFQLISFGADGKYGGEGEDADVVYPPIKKKKLGFFEWLFKK